MVDGGSTGALVPLGLAMQLQCGPMRARWPLVGGPAAFARCPLPPPQPPSRAPPRSRSWSSMGSCWGAGSSSSTRSSSMGSSSTAVVSHPLVRKQQAPPLAPPTQARGAMAAGMPTAAAARREGMHVRGSLPRHPLPKGRLPSTQCSTRHSRRSKGGRGMRGHQKARQKQRRTQGGVTPTQS